MRAEKRQRPGKEAAGSRHAPGVVRQTVPADTASIGPQTQPLREQVRRRENRTTAFKRGQATQGAPGIDGMTVEELPADLRQAWPSSREQLLNATDEPAPGRAVSRPKPGRGTRRLGMPTVLDRVSAPASLQVLGALVDPDCSVRSDGFRPGRSAHQALERSWRDIADGDRWVVKLDLEQWFDRGNHDMVMRRVAQKVQDTRLLKLSRRYLNAGIMQDGVGSQREAGLPQGSPRSPRLSTLLLADFDKELEPRGPRFCRDADAANVYVRSQRAGLRVMAALTRFLESRRRLKGNRVQSVVDRSWPCTCLGDTVTNHRRPRVKPAPRAVTRAKDRRRQIPPQGRGRPSRTVITEINRFTRGWVGSVRRSTVTHQFEGREQWTRRRLRKLVWEPWRKPRSRSRTLVTLGLEVERARKATATGRGAWWKAGASHRPAAGNKRVLAEWGLWSLLEQRRDLERST